MREMYGSDLKFETLQVSEENRNLKNTASLVFVAA